MALFTTNFSGNSTSEVANNTTPTGITDWTWDSAGSSSFQNGTIVTDAGAIGGKVLRIEDTGWGQNIFMYPTSIGSIASGTETQILVSWRLNNTTASYTSYGHVQTPIARSPATTGAQRHAVGFHKNGAALESQLWEFRNADDWTNTGAASTLTGFAAGDWWWTRLFVNAAGEWQWKSWKDGESEPSYFISLTSNTATTSGYCGVGAYDIDYDPIDYQYFSVGTGGTPPDEPAGGATLVVPMFYPKRVFFEV